MTYIHRSLERKLLKTSSAFKVVMETGARQVGTVKQALNTGHKTVSYKWLADFFVQK